VNILLLFYLVV